MSRFGLTSLMIAIVLASACGSKTGLREPPAGGTGGDAGVDAPFDAPVDARVDVITDGGCVSESEQCNGLDDDCDGVVDDGVACFFLNGQALNPVPAAGCGASWYSYNFPDPESANPMPDIRRSGEVVLAVQYESSCGAHLAVIADLPNDGSGGQLAGTFTSSPAGSVGLVVADEPGECQQVGADVLCNWVWQPCCTDGALLGPLPNDSCVTIQLGNTAGVSGLIVLDGDGGESALSFPVVLELCTTIKPPAN